MRKIIGLWSGHDASFVVLDEGVPIIHTEAERHLRVKEPPADSIKMFYEHYGITQGVIGLSTCWMPKGIKDHSASWDKIKDLAALTVVGHHQAHAANAFYSSNFHDAIIITVDGGGIENESGLCVGASVWKGYATSITNIDYIPLERMNIGGVWSRTTRHIFGYESGFPQGNQCGTTMALAALGDPNKYLADFKKMLTTDLAHAVSRAPGHVAGMSVKDPKNPKHPYHERFAQIARDDNQAKYDMAASMQLATEHMLRDLIANSLDKDPQCKNLCISGGVALNSVAMGKIRDWFPQLENVFIPPIPYDAGLTIGSAQYTWHHVMKNFRVHWLDNAKPYLGKHYSTEEVMSTIDKYVGLSQVTLENVSDETVIDLLDKGKIVSVFNRRAESGRRALGNRSILADPRNPWTKDQVNDKVKHRQWFRPFAPSIMREKVGEWFTTDCDSPYMGFVLKFKEEKKNSVPAVVHFDGTARLQTVTERDNHWYYNFLKQWEAKTGVPILLNTSYNDKEPIVETPDHALKCFLGTAIDALYFPEHGFLVKKKT